ncbi:MAG TPA: hypothetical protein VKY26_03835 [Actinomycetota bacterium]|nr:hypothetical protein [Actinomycetota bacterium]
MTIESQSTQQYLPAEHQVGTGIKERASAAGTQLKEALPDGDAVKSAVNGAVQQAKEVLPDGDTVKSAVNGAVQQAKEVLPDPDQVKQEFLEAAHRLQEILPDGDDLKQMIVRVAEEVRDDPDIRRHVEAAAEVASTRVQNTVGAGIDVAAGKLREGVTKAGLEDLGYVAERMGEIVKEGVGELVEETKSRALDALPEPEPYQPGGGPQHLQQSEQSRPQSQKGGSSR